MITLYKNEAGDRKLIYQERKFWLVFMDKPSMSQEASWFVAYKMCQNSRHLLTPDGEYFLNRLRWAHENYDPYSSKESPLFDGYSLLTMAMESKNPESLNKNIQEIEETQTKVLEEVEFCLEDMDESIAIERGEL